MKNYWIILTLLFCVNSFAGQTDAQAIGALAAESSTGSTRGYLGNAHVSLKSTTHGGVTTTRGYVGNTAVNTKTKSTPDGKITTGYVGDTAIRVKTKK